jgi:hypothetical protein
VLAGVGVTRLLEGHFPPRRILVDVELVEDFHVEGELTRCFNRSHHPTPHQPEFRFSVLN